MQSTFLTNISFIDSIYSLNIQNRKENAFKMKIKKKGTNSKHELSTRLSKKRKNLHRFFKPIHYLYPDLLFCFLKEKETILTFEGQI